MSELEEVWVSSKKFAARCEEARLTLANEDALFWTRLSAAQFLDAHNGSVNDGYYEAQERARIQLPDGFKSWDEWKRSFR